MKKAILLKETKKPNKRGWTKNLESAKLSEQDEWSEGIE